MGDTSRARFAVLRRKKHVSEWRINLMRLFSLSTIGCSCNRERLLRRPGGLLAMTDKSCMSLLVPVGCERSEAIFLLVNLIFISSQILDCLLKSMLCNLRAKALIAMTCMNSALCQFSYRERREKCINKRFCLNILLTLVFKCAINMQLNNFKALNGNSRR